MWAGLPIVALEIAQNVLVLTGRIAAADEDCPPLLARQLAGHAPACRLLREGQLESGRGNSAVVYRLYRWIAAGWQRIAADRLNPETGRGRATALAAHLPADHYIAKGIALDYVILSGETHVWRRSDPNCCPTGGRLRIRLALAGDNLRLFDSRSPLGRLGQARQDPFVAAAAGPL